MMWDGAWGWHWIGMITFWIVPVALIVLLAFGFSRWVRPNEKVDESALQILEKRYAKGEISEQDFERMKGNLSHA